MNLLEDWCRGMEVDIHRSLLVTGIPADCGQAEIEETLNGVLSPLGTYRVLNRIFLRAENVKAALVEVGEGVNVSTVPREFPGRGGVWRVACRDPTQDAEFLKNLNEFLDAEGRTWEDVVRLLQLNHPPRPQNQPWENWAEALGVLLGAAVQVVFCIDAELRSREEARAQEAEEELAAWALVARKKVKKEPGLATEVGSALKVENLIRFNEQCDPPKPFVHRAGAKSRSRRKKQKRNSRQDAAPWKKPKGNHSNGSAYLVTRPEVCHPRNMAISKPNKSNQRARVKQEWVLKRSLAKSAWKVPRGRPQGALLEAKSPESHRDGGQESPPKRKAFRKSLVPVRKKKVSLGPVSYLHGHPKDAKKSVILRKGPGSRRAGPAHRAPRGPQPGGAPASASRGPKAKPGGFPCASKGENDHRTWMKWVGVLEWQAGAEKPMGRGGCQLGDQGDPRWVTPSLGEVLEKAGAHHWMECPGKAGKYTYR